MKPEDFIGRGPTLVLEDYFAGTTTAWGLVEDRFGKVRRQFRVTIVGRRTADGIELDETFRYDDGGSDHRVWSVTRLGKSRYSGTAHDVVGAALGRAAGPALSWRYRLRLRIGRRTWTVAFDDWMLLQGDGVLINRAILRKWGIRLGQVTLFFRQEPVAGHLEDAATRQAAA